MDRPVSLQSGPGGPVPGSPEAIDVVIEPRARDLYGLAVERVLPAFARQMVGPIEEAKSAWAGGRFPKIPGEVEFTPLPERPARPGAIS